VATGESMEKPQTQRRSMAVQGGATSRVTIQQSNTIQTGALLSGEAMNDTR
jgi:hypothetical protein